MNEASPVRAVDGAQSDAVRLGNLPFVFLSYDEPWADDTWKDLKRKVPGAVRVHGVKGLDACHKAAADAVPGDWVVTVDADTVVDSALPGILVPRYLMRSQYRLDWLSRNSVNGLWTGNGCVKLWSKLLLREMRTHEAAPEGRISIDHDIGNVVPGQSGQLTRPERASETDPARTPFHAFRAGFREAVFLHRMAAEDAERRRLPDWKAAATARVLGIWCSVGRHARNGPWVLYGARLGLLWHMIQPDWDPRRVNDYDWLKALWDRRISPRFGAGREWRWDWLERELSHLGERLDAQLEFPVAEFDADASRVVARSDLLSPNPAASRSDALGYRLMMSCDDRGTLEAAREYLEIARILDHPSAFDNLGTAHRRGIGPDASHDEAAWNFRAAAVLANQHAEVHLQELGQSIPLPDQGERPARLAADYAYFADGKRPEEGAGDFCFVAGPGVEPGPAMARHVPDPALCRGGHVIGYAARCALTGRIIPGALRFGPVSALASDPHRDAIAMLPVVLGLRAAPDSAEAAIALAKSDVASGVVLPGFARLGRNGAFGEDYVGAVQAVLQETGSPEVEWSAVQSGWMDRLLPDIAPRREWDAAAESLARTGRQGRALARMLRRTADAVWGRRPS